MHIGYALIVAASLIRHGDRMLVRIVGALYPPVVLGAVVATGNHFFFDAAAGALVAGVAAIAAVLIAKSATPRLGALPTQREAPPPSDELAA
jgi:hypothetical protein